ncbi:MAG: NADH-quinone oxidoreductase subunit C [Gammaproteobacteria bacterium]|nr:NADH-quinone oxidoreductase subunit C [Gammaproteobacteria bacterium]
MIIEERRVTIDTYFAECAALRDREGFTQLTDLTVIDYLTYGQSEWVTQQATTHGFGRGKLALDLQKGQKDRNRFEVVIHLLNYQENRRVKVRCFVPVEVMTMPSLFEIWASANWYEREAFDLFGVAFDRHPDLRRLLTDYGFCGYPLRKDFPMMGYDQIIYDRKTEVCVHEEVRDRLRVPVPKVIRFPSSPKKEQL